MAIILWWVRDFLLPVCYYSQIARCSQPGLIAVVVRVPPQTLLQIPILIFYGGEFALDAL